MRNYWISLFSSLTLFGVVYTFHRSQKESDQPLQNVALGSLIHTETLKSAITKAPKEHKNRVLRKIYTKDAIESLKLPTAVNQKFLSALDHQLVFLKKAEDDKYGNLTVEIDDLEKVIDVLRNAKSTQDVITNLDAYQIIGDGKGGVQFTGYYSPSFNARTKKDDVYQQPVCIVNQSPKSGDESYKIVYVREYEQVKTMKTEGSAFLVYPDGKREVVAFNNGTKTIESEQTTSAEDHDLTSMATETPKTMSSTYAKFLANEKLKPVGASKVPLTSDISIAVDDNFIPLGSVLLAEVPVLDEQGNLVRYDYRYVLAQDTGGKIKGVSHIDLYMGEGDKAAERIKHMSQYGRLWLLLPKENNEPKLLADNIEQK